VTDFSLSQVNQAKKIYSFILKVEQIVTSKAILEKFLEKRVCSLQMATVEQDLAIVSRKVPQFSAEWPHFLFKWPQIGHG